MNKTSRSVGFSAESLAIEILKPKGFVILERNFKSRFGEIDIIASKEGILYFIEVKARWSLRFGMPEEAVTLGKIHKIQKTGQYYALTRPNSPQKQRILVVSMVMDGEKVANYKLIDVF